MHDMIPDKCCIRTGLKACMNAPSYIISILDGSRGEYMIGLVCREHVALVERLVELKQKHGEIPEGSVRFTELKSVATSCNYL
ncbi:MULTISPECIES: hypothetical protein [Candidatus Nitrosocaldus]|jgi:hypothetical protein|uniref:Uncharacterized protein n=1 Tax=Candidatus Nitrosocaldus cavascurensis TaxID=2058097 RepID=A0A2K5APB0_9ARCH|nr:MULTISPECIES: hypothetical protein [Candidatus Nitrosocaldus]SPC33449.1 conserved protein of unknown function [Candidatus Nitrosocaldus cavascurensis]